MNGFSETHVEHDGFDEIAGFQMGDRRGVGHYGYESLRASLLSMHLADPLPLQSSRYTTRLSILVIWNSRCVPVDTTTHRFHAAPHVGSLKGRTGRIPSSRQIRD